MKHYTILYNPHAANGHGLENALRLKENIAAETELCDMTALSGYGDFFAALPKESQLVICGGDGTLDRFINDTVGTERPKHILYHAGGSGNDFLRDVGGDKDTLVELDRYMESLPTVTVRTAGGEQSSLFLNGIGYGIDGYCCEVGDELREASDKSINYTAIAIKGLLFHYKPHNATVTVDGVRHTYKKVWLAPTMNGRYYGGGMMPTPAQDRLCADRTVSVMIFHGTGKLRTLMIFPSIFTGEHIKKTEAVEVLTGHEITVEYDSPAPLQIDGETVRAVTSYTVASAVDMGAGDRYAWQNKIV